MILDINLPTAHDDGRFISAKISRLVELIREYDPRLDVKWIPPDFRGSNDPAFAIVERLSDGSEHVAFYVQDEQSFDEGVLQRIYLGDTAHHDVQARIEAQNKAARALALAEQRETQDQFADFVGSMIRSPKHTYKHGGRRFDL